MPFVPKKNKKWSSAKQHAPLPTNLKYFLIYKPFGMMSQFSKDGDKPTLADLGINFDKDIYPVGRLDHDSEGLLLLTNDRRVNDAMLNPKHHYSKTYWVQVDREITDDALDMLRSGVTIKAGEEYRTKPASARRIDEPKVPERVPPIRFRINVPTSWVELTISEGKNRQVRKMTAAVGFPTLRLIRVAIGDLHLADMQPGEVREIKLADLHLDFTRTAQGKYHR